MFRPEEVPGGHACPGHKARSTGVRAVTRNQLPVGQPQGRHSGLPAARPRWVAPADHALPLCRTCRPVAPDRQANQSVRRSALSRQSGLGGGMWGGARSTPPPPAPPHRGGGRFRGPSVGLSIRRDGRIRVRYCAPGPASGPEAGGHAARRGHRPGDLARHAVDRQRHRHRDQPPHRRAAHVPQVSIAQVPWDTGLPSRSAFSETKRTTRSRSPSA